MDVRKKRKIDSESCPYREEWGVKYFFVHSSDKAVCVICNETVAVLKEYNMKRHYETKHQKEFAQYIGVQRLDKFSKMQTNLSSQQSLFTKAKTENESVKKASYKVAYVLAKKGKPFTDGDIVKECL